MSMRVAVIGMGGPGKGHAKHVSASAKAELVAIADIDRTKAEDAAREYGANAYVDVRDMLERESLDAVFLCTPPWTRAELVPEIAQRGLALFCEKPMPCSTDCSVLRLWNPFPVGLKSLGF